MNRYLNPVLGLLVGTGALLLAVSPLPGQEPDKKKADHPLVGTYTIVSGVEDGKKVPASHIDSSLVAITGNTIIGEDKDKNQFFACEYTLDTSKKPWVIHMTSIKPRGEKSDGLVKKEGDTVTIIYALPGGKTPTEFKAGEKQHLFVLKKTKPVEPKTEK
jgi:uncharacterized protein (TIGR03067 family)